MDCQLPEPTPQNRVTRFSANYSINGPYSANYSLVDFSCLDEPDCREICSPVYVRLSQTQELQIIGCEDDIQEAETLTCFEQDPPWVAGLQRTISDASNITSVEVTSFFEFLNEKSISTQLFQPARLSVVLDTVFRFYAGVRMDLIDIVSFTETSIVGPVEGNTFSELQQLAQAGRANLFVQVGGQLTIEKWKDHTDPVEFTIPECLVIDADRAQYRFPSTSLIRVAGASVSTLNCGDQTLTNNPVGPGAIRKCVSSGYPTPCVSVTFNNLNGDKQDILSSTLISDAATSEDPKENVEDGGFQQTVENTTGEFIDQDTTFFNFLLQGPIRSDQNERQPNGVQNNNQVNSNSNPDTINQRLISNGFPIPFSSFQLGAFGGETFHNNSFSFNVQGNQENTSLTQTEVVAFAADFSDCGITQEQLTAKYLVKPEDLFFQALRRYQEIILAQNTWNVTVPHIPCLKINQVVEFTVPRTRDCQERVVKGIVGGISVEKESGSEPSMKIAIMDTSCLGQRELESGNLIAPVCQGDASSGLASPWISSELGLESQAYVAQTLLVIFSSGNVQGNAFYTHQCATDHEYEVSFDYEALISGTDNFTFTAPGTLESLTGSGSFITTFTPTSDTFDLQWRLSSLGPESYRITNLFLRKRVFA